MNATLAPLPPETKPAPCAQSLTRANESLQARERLLTATARASRLLLQAPDVRAAIPDVLELIGNAATLTGSISWRRAPARTVSRCWWW